MKAVTSKPVIIHPLASRRPTGMATAARGLDALLVPAQANGAPRLDRWFHFINDVAPFAALKMLLRLLLVQLVPLLLRRRRLLFSSHHGPLWATGRHALIVYDLTALRHARAKTLQSLYLRRLLPRAARAATRVVTISAPIGEEVRAHLGVNSDVIPCFSPTLSLAAARPWRAGGRHVLVIGAHFSHKNLDLALAAVRHARKALGADLRLVVAGCRRELWWRENGGLAVLVAEGWLDVHDYAATEDVLAWMSSAACLLYPSLAEGQGLPPLEALAAGCPVVCADIPVLRDTCGDAAFFVDPRDSIALATLLSNLRQGEPWAELARQRAATPAVLELFPASRLQAAWESFFLRWL